jgi:Tol biopolymer transport system component
MLAAGSTLGPYKIVAPLGAGGMGEVYRAHDTRLGRDVAIKVLSPHLAATPEVRARFEREARTISQLNHPHICTLHDIGHQDGVDYLVMELLEGETLAHRLEKGPLPVAEVLALGTQIADALDRAHRAGVVHRDLKPGNVMLTKAGAKLMDFGLARAAGVATAPGALTESPTVSRPLTAEGTVVGTFQYMAPEQLEGKEADARTDLWALGCVLYEMATGKRAFEGQSQASLISAIMDREPRPITELEPLTPPALERTVKRSLMKDPDDRWQSARDVMHELQWIAATGSQAGVPSPAVGRRAHRSRLAWLLTGLLGVAIGAAIGFLFVRKPHLTDASRLKFTRLTVQHGTILNARFSADGRTVFYTASWNGRPPETFETRPGFPASRALGLAETSLLSVSGDGRLAVRIGTTNAWSYRGWSTLAEVPISGGAPRRILDDVQWADWSPDGRTLAVSHHVGSEVRLELPPGRVLYKTAGSLFDIRISPNKQHLAFADHPVPGDYRGTVVIMDTAGRVVARTSEWNSAYGLAWSADGRELWYCGSQDDASSDLRAITTRGRERVVARFAGRWALRDVGQNGQALLTQVMSSVGIRGRRSTHDEERELGWFDSPIVKDISTDGRTLLFEEQGIYGGPLYAVCLRGMDGSAPVRLGQGSARALSPDGKWALAIHYGPPHRLLLLPTGAGDSTSLPRGPVEKYYAAFWMPDGKSVVFAGSEPGHAQRSYLQDLKGGLPRPITPEGIAGSRVSPDGRLVAAVSGDQRLFICPTGGDSSQFVTQLLPAEDVLQWAADGRAVYVGAIGTMTRVDRVDLATGRRTLWRTFGVPDSAGADIFYVILTPNGQGYAYSYMRELEDLYLVDGLK